MNLNDHNPLTLESAISVIEANLDGVERDYIRKNGVVGLHHGAGTVLRNTWLWDNPAEGRIQPLAQHFRDRFGLGHADDMSGMILSGVHARVIKAEFSPEVHAKKYREYWKKQNCDPMTGEPVAV